MKIEYLLLASSPTRSRSTDGSSPTTRRCAESSPRRLSASACTRPASAPSRTSDQANDYAAHSAALHATPASRNHPLAGKGRLAEDSYPLDDAGFWEIFEHTRRIIIALMASGQVLAHEPARISTDALPVAGDAWRRTQEIQDGYLTVLNRLALLPRGDE